MPVGKANGENMSTSGPGQFPLQGILRIKANGTSKSTHTSIGSRIGTDVPQSNDIFGLESCSKAQELRSSYLANRKQQRP